MMCMNMSELRVLVEFFKQNVDKFRRGARILLERIEDFDKVNEADDTSSEGADEIDDNFAEHKFSGISSADLKMSVNKSVP